MMFPSNSFTTNVSKCRSPSLRFIYVTCVGQINSIAIFTVEEEVRQYRFDLEEFTI